MLQEIFQLEDSNQFDQAYYAYKDIYELNRLNYQIWKHFYFFLWLAIEDAPKEFSDKINLRHELQILLDNGRQNFSSLADFNFIAGYTTSIFPYEYENFENLEKESREMLKQATEIVPSDPIYKMVYLGSESGFQTKKYEQSVKDAAPLVLDRYSGSGSLNKYFRQVLNRTP